MEVSSIICDVLKRLGMDNEYNLENLKQVKDDEIDKIMMSINCVISEIATDYIPCSHAEELLVVDGSVAYQSFSKNVVEVKKISSGDINVKFAPQVERLRVFCADGIVKVDYNYSLDKLKQSDSFKMSPRVSGQLIVIGVVADYLAMAGRVDESLMHDRRYREGLRLAMRDNKSRYLKARRFY